MNYYIRVCGQVTHAEWHKNIFSVFQHQGVEYISSSVSSSYYFISLTGRYCADVIATRYGLEGPRIKSH